MAGGAITRGQSGIAQQLQQRLGEGGCIAWGQQPARNPILHQVRQPAAAANFGTEPPKAAGSSPASQGEGRRLPPSSRLAATIS